MAGCQERNNHHSWPPNDNNEQQLLIIEQQCNDNKQKDSEIETFQAALTLARILFPQQHAMRRGKACNFCRTQRSVKRCLRPVRALYKHHLRAVHDLFTHTSRYLCAPTCIVAPTTSCMREFDVAFVLVPALQHAMQACADNTASLLDSSWLIQRAIYQRQCCRRAQKVSMAAAGLPVYMLNSRRKGSKSNRKGSRKKKTQLQLEERKQGQCGHRWLEDMISY